jgi:membrane-associated phospholipid phosphatase
MSGFVGRPRRAAGIIVGVFGLVAGWAAAPARAGDAEGAASVSGNASVDDNANAQTSSAQSANAGTSASASTVPIPNPEAPPKQHSPLLLDIEAYYTSPLHWDMKDWAYFGGAIGLLAAAHHYDGQVRTHFIAEGTQAKGGSTKDLQDAIPAVAAVVGTWAYANLIDSSDGHREAYEMVEAAGLSLTTSYALKFAAGRERPDQTSDPDKWRTSGGSSFPSTHAAAAFAIGAVLAESGNDDYRWMRRFLGYGAVAGYTAYERLKHNAHWLSDDVAGAEIGGATAHFVMEREKERREARKNYTLSLVPLEGGAMLTYSLNIE